MDIQQLETLDDDYLEQLFTRLNGRYADHFHPLSDEVIASYESLTFPVPTLLDERTGEMCFNRKELQALLAQMYEQQGIVPDYLLLHDHDLRACLYTRVAHTHCWGCHAVGEDISVQLTYTYNHQYWADTHMKHTQFIRDDRLPQGTMTFLYQHDGENHAS